MKYYNDEYVFDFYVEDKDDFRKYRLVRSALKEKAKKVLFVMEYVPAQTLKDKSDNLLSPEMLDTFRNLIGLAKLPDFDWLICSYNACRTAYHSDTYIERAHEAFEERLLGIVESYKPHTIVVFGDKPFSIMCKKESDMLGENLHFYHGVPVKKTISGNPVTIVKCPDIDAIFSGDEAQISLSGYIAQNLRNAYYEKIEYQIERPESEVVLVDTPKRFTKFMKLLYEQPIVSIDTETDNLYKIKNRVLTIQFSFDAQTAYIIPLCHKDSTFTGDELRHVFDRLRDYFETNTADYHIFANAQFDLNVMRTQFKIRFFNAPVWDIFAGEWALDENLKFMQSVSGGYYYSLGCLSVQYGDNFYLESNFKKSDRATISKVDLTDDLLGYMGADVLIPYAIHEKQMLRAKAQNYKKYKSMVTEQLSDVIHSLATLEYNGYYVDIDYLFSLKLPNSPIEQEINKLADQFNESPNVKKVNKMIAAEQGMPINTLFGDGSTTLFSLRKKDHLFKLFFEALKLKPLKLGKNKKGKLDKAFQEEYKSVDEVKAYSAWQKACKLRNAYVNQMLKFWGDNEDFKSDRRIRCRYNYLPVITGRVSASEPGLQQIPSRSELGKHIKRLFIAPRNRIIVKVDYRAHEVRGWGIISKEDGVAKAFSVGQKLIQEYKHNPSPELLARIETEGDVHKVNCSYFFQKKIGDVTKEDRDAIKGVVFGLIYGQMLKTMAKNLKKTEEEMQAIIDGFFDRFKKGTSWFTQTQKQAMERTYVESPVGRRRHLYYIYSKSAAAYDYVKSVFDRRSCNSPIQGMGSDFMMMGIRSFCRHVWDYYREHDYLPAIIPCVSVHDSLEVETDYKHLLLTIKFIEQSLTHDVKQLMRNRHNFELNSDLEIDFEIGVTTDKLHKWFGDLSELESIAYQSIINQNKKLKYSYTDDEITEMMESIFNKKHMTDWMLYQAKNKYPKFLDYSFDKDDVNV